MSKRRSRVTDRQRTLQDALLVERYRSRWWGTAGKPADRLYLTRVDQNQRYIVDPLKVYLEFQTPGNLLGARLVVVTGPDTNLPADLRKRAEEIRALYASALYVAKQYDTPAALRTYLTQCRRLSVPTGELPTH